MRAAMSTIAGNRIRVSIIAGPTPFTDYVGRFRVVQTGTAHCRVEYRGRYRARDGHSEAEATERIRTFYEAAIRESASVIRAVVRPSATVTSSVPGPRALINASGGPA